MPRVRIPGLPVLLSFSLISQSRRWLAASLLCGVGVLAACGSGDRGDVVVLWRLADGRSCVDTSMVRAIVTVAGQTPEVPFESRCSQTAENNRATVIQATAGARLLVRGETVAKTVVYRGEVRVPSPVPALLDVTLSYTGGQ